MGSVRSASTAYSSGGLFGRNRHNSVYSSPDAGIPPGGLPGPGQVLPHKMTLYDRIVGRKSGRGQFRQPRTSEYILFLFNTSTLDLFDLSLPFP